MVTAGGISMVNEAWWLVLAGLLSTVPLLSVAIGLVWFRRPREMRVGWGELLFWCLVFGAAVYWLVRWLMLLG
jgi:hypothetical protein